MTQSLILRSLFDLEIAGLKFFDQFIPVVRIPFSTTIGSKIEYAVRYPIIPKNGASDELRRPAVF
jgi:hypothetical protein